MLFAEKKGVLHFFSILFVGLAVSLSSFVTAIVQATNFLDVMVDNTQVTVVDEDTIKITFEVNGLPVDWDLWLSVEIKYWNEDMTSSGSVVVSNTGDNVYEATIDGVIPNEAYTYQILIKNSEGEVLFEITDLTFYIEEIVDEITAKLTFSVRGSDWAVEIGKREVIAEFKLDETESDSDHGAIIYSIKLKNIGTASLDHLEEIILYKGEETVSVETVIDGSYVTFNLGDTGIVMDNFSVAYFSIEADIISGSDVTNYRFDLENSEDLNAIDLVTEMIVGVVNQSIEGLKVYTVSTGGVTVSLHPSTPSSTEYSKGTPNTPVLITKVDLDQVVSVDSFRLYLAYGTLVSANVNSAENELADFETLFENFALYINDSIVDSQSIITDVNNNGLVDLGIDYLEFNTPFSLDDNDLIKIYVDIKNAEFDYVQLKVKIDNSEINKSLQGVRYIFNEEFLSSSKFAGSATSNTVEVIDSAAGFGLVLRDDTSDFPVVAGQPSVEFMKFLINGSAASNIEISRLNFDFDFLNNNLNYIHFNNFKLLVDGEQIGWTENLASTSPTFVTFDNLNLELPQNGQVEISLVGNVDLTAVADEMTITLDVDGSLLLDNNGEQIINDYDLQTGTIQVVEKGQLFVELDQSHTPQERIISVSDESELVAKFEFQAEHDDVIITDLYFANIDNLENDTIITDTDARVASYDLVVNDLVLDSRVPSGGKIHFDLANDKYIVVEKYNGIYVKVKANLNSINSDTETNKIVTLELRDIEAVSGTTGLSLNEINGLDVGSIDRTDNYNNTGLAADDIAGYTQYIRKTQPTLAAQMLSTTVLTSGRKTIYKVNVAADVEEDIVVWALAFKTSGQVGGAVIEDIVGNTLVGDTDCDGVADDIIIDGFKFYVNGEDKTSEGAFSIIEIGDTNSFKVTFQFTEGRDEEISKWGVATFELKADFIGVIGDDYISTEILEDEDLLQGDFETLNGTAPYFLWSDNAGSPHRRTTSDWFNGYVVNGLRTDAIVLERGGDGSWGCDYNDIDLTDARIENIQVEVISPFETEVSFELNGLATGDYEKVTSKVVYGLDENYGSGYVIIDSNGDNLYEGVLIDLEANNTYFYKVQIKDLAGNLLLESDSLNFTTLDDFVDVKIENINSTEVGINNVQINFEVTGFPDWFTSDLKVLVYYGLEEYSNNTAPLPVGFNGFYNVDLSTLDSNTTYIYRIVVQDSNGSAWYETSDGLAFTTLVNPDLSDLDIEFVELTDVSQSGATILMAVANLLEIDTISYQAVLDYGTTSNLSDGSVVAEYIGDNVFKFQLENLSTDTIYQYRVRVKNTAGIILSEEMGLQFKTVKLVDNTEGIKDSVQGPIAFDFSSSGQEQTITSNLVLSKSGATLGSLFDQGMVLEIESGTIINNIQFVGQATWSGSFLPPSEVNKGNVFQTGWVIEGEDDTLNEDDVLKVIKIGTPENGISLKLNKQVLVRIPFPTELNGQFVGILYSIDGQNWKYKGDYEVIDGFVSFYTDHFTLFAVTAVPSKATFKTNIINDHVKVALYDLTASGADKYNIYRQTTDSDWDLANPVETDFISGTWEETVLAAGVTYYYRVRGVNSAGLGLWSDSQKVLLPVISNPSTGSSSSTGGGSNKFYSSKSFYSTSEKKVEKEDPKEFTDLKKHWAKKYIDDLSALGIVEGVNGSDDFYPEYDITRVEFLKIALKSVKSEWYEVTENQKTDFLNMFTDIKNEADMNQWWAKYVYYAYKKGFIEGYADGSFHPNGKISRAEALKILADINNMKLKKAKDKPFRDVRLGYWDTDYINTFKNKEFISGYAGNVFQPKGEISRGEVAKLVALVIED